MRRTPTIYKPDMTIEGVSAGDIQNAQLEDRHFADNEILPKKIATVEGKVAVPIAIDFEVDADATGGLLIFNANAPFKMRIIDVIVQSKATSATGTLTFDDGTNDITDAIVCAVDKVVARAGTIDAAYATIPKGGSLEVVANTATDVAQVTILALKID